ncbi:MAG TPA: hypothetical protein VI322_03890 [Candidatus Saccharimonadia bacterium]
MNPQLERIELSGPEPLSRIGGVEVYIDAGAEPVEPVAEFGPDAEAAAETATEIAVDAPDSGPAHHVGPDILDIEIEDLDPNPPSQLSDDVIPSAATLAEVTSLPTRIAHLNPAAAVEAKLLEHAA